MGIQLETPISVGRIDVLRLATNEVWDVKPPSYVYEPNRSKGIAQVSRYVNAIGGK